MENNLIDSYKDLYCVECKSLCVPYEQGICCCCDSPWITEVIHEDEYPDKWIKVRVNINKLYNNKG